VSSSSEPVPRPVFDIVGIGFGPANLALAIAVAEHNAAAGAEERITARFVERQPEFGWHRGMLIDGAVMQVSFLKDLATMRNPTSTFGFVPYLHSQGRLADFVNHKILFPTREEFHDYLSWAADRLGYLVRYGTEAVELRPVTEGGATLLADVVCRQADDGSAARTYRARNVVFAPGLRPTVPAGVVLSDRVWHSSELLHKLAGHPPAARRFVVVGAGQSAAECTEYLHRRFPAAEVCAIFMRYGYSPADDSPFANRIFDNDAVGEFFHASTEVKAALMDYHRNTNYSVVDLDLIEDLYRRAYRERIRGEARLHMINASRVTHLGERSDCVRVGVRRMLDGSVTHLDADAVVFATGYAPIDVGSLLGDLNHHCLRDPAGRPVVTRDYRIRTLHSVRCGLYLQGGTEHTHGITSSLLSNVAVRAGEIFASILARRGAESTTLLAA
jgi:L-ornithine N5-monooxygenase